jgi:hypothetical protein
MNEIVYILSTKFTFRRVAGGNGRAVVVKFGIGSVRVVGLLVRGKSKASSRHVGSCSWSIRHAAAAGPVDHCISIRFGRR